MKHLSTILILFMISFTPSLAQESAEERLNEVIGIQELAKELKTLKQGWGAYKLGDYEDAFSIWMPLAETGNPSAQVFIGLLYNQGHGVIKETVSYRITKKLQICTIQQPNKETCIHKNHLVLCIVKALEFQKIIS